MAARSSVCLLLLLACTLGGLCAEPGRKELRTKVVNHDQIIQLGRPLQYNAVDPTRVIQLSWRPRVFLYQGFLSDVESDHLISLVSGKGNDSVTRSDIVKDEVTKKIEERISAWTFIPKENGKPLQILHFRHEDPGKNHNYFGENFTVLDGKPLMGTVVLHLSNVTKGGQIVFPESQNKISSGCMESAPNLRPIKGNAILFFNVHLDGTPDGSSVHTRCPVLKDEMWVATKFFSLNSVDTQKVVLQSEDGDCMDEDVNCPRWAAIGECERNPVFMVGSPDYYGACRKSCNAC